jgi:hypothetical protein
VTLLPVRAFSGGVTLEGSPDVKRGAELEACDEFDIGPRGGLVVASAAEAWLTFLAYVDMATRYAELRKVSACREDHTGGTMVAAGFIGNGVYTAAADLFDRGAGAPSTVPAVNRAIFEGPPGFGSTNFIVTIVTMPFYRTDTIGGVPYESYHQTFICFGAKEGTLATLAPGLGRIGYYDKAGVATFAISQMMNYDALGTGPMSLEFPGGALAQNLKFRGIFRYGPLLCGYGMPSTANPNLNGDNRLMFSSPTNPFKWGRDDQSGGAGNRIFRDIDAVIIGGVGEVIRAGVEWGGRAWIGTNVELHWLSGYGVDSFVTDGTRSQAKQNVLGAHCLIEGPDHLLHGCGSKGHWIFDGSDFTLSGLTLVDFEGRSPGYWDLITGTNESDVWLMRDDVQQQVWIAIPACDAVAGHGDGSDTVIIKYHCLTGGYTRQVFLGAVYRSGCYVGREGVLPEVRALAHANYPSCDMHRYGHKATSTDTRLMSTGTPLLGVTRVLAGPEGSGLLTRGYLTLGWSATALPIVLSVALSADGEAADVVRLTVGAVAPVAPADGDLWVDTSGTDANIGTAVAGALIPASADYVVKAWGWGKWTHLVGGSQKGGRATIPVPFKPTNATRATVTVTQVSAAQRYQVEAFAFDGQGAA